MSDDAFADPVRDAIAAAEAAIKHAEHVVRAQYIACTDQDLESLRTVLSQCVQAHTHVYKGRVIYDAHRANPQPVSTPAKKEDEP